MMTYYYVTDKILTLSLRHSRGDSYGMERYIAKSYIANHIIIILHILTNNAVVIITS